MGRGRERNYDDAGERRSREKRRGIVYTMLLRKSNVVIHVYINGKGDCGSSYDVLRNSHTL
jgi:hypothetical protein